MSNYNNEELIELQNRVQSLEASRNRLREALKEINGFKLTYQMDRAQAIHHLQTIARKALEG